MKKVLLIGMLALLVLSTALVYAEDASGDGEMVMVQNGYQHMYQCEHKHMETRQITVEGEEGVTPVEEFKQKFDGKMFSCQLVNFAGGI